MLAIGREEDVAVRSIYVGTAAEDRYHARQVPVADIVLAAARGEAAVAVGGQERREDALTLDELQEVCVPHALMIVLLERRLAAGLEEVDGGQQCASSLIVEVRRIVRAGIEQDGPRPFLRRSEFDCDRTLL